MSVIEYGTGNAHFDEWVDHLAITDLPQAQGALLRVDTLTGNAVGYCCLGEGCTVAGFEPRLRERESANLMNVGRVYQDYADFLGHTTLAPIEFLNWLSINTAYLEDDESDIWLDWPEAFHRAQGPVDQGTGEPVYETGMAQTRLSCIDLNDDANLTFAQIADMLRYFGIQGSV